MTTSVPTPQSDVVQTNAPMQAGITELSLTEMALVSGGGFILSEKEQIKPLGFILSE